MAEKEYIEREAAINEQKRFCGYLDNDMLNRLEIATKRIPAADVRPVVRGKWKRDYNPNGSSNWQTCSACYAFILLPSWRIENWNFCPNCGADMREES